LLRKSVYGKHFVEEKVLGGEKKKMKKKTLVVVGIAVGALLLTAPVLASAGYSKIYGNANEDEVLDMRDVTYTKLVIFGKKPATTFADANYDGKISMLDVGQAKLIILGKEKKLTLIDMADRTVTVPRPIERVVTFSPPITRMVIGLDAEDKLVGMGSYDYKHTLEPGRGPRWDEVVDELKDLPGVGTSGEPNQEEILSLKPDVVFGSTSVADKIQESTGIPVVCYKGRATCDSMFAQIEFVGAVVGRGERAEEIVSFFKEKLDKVTEVTSEINENEKPTVLFLRDDITRTTNVYEAIDLAGGINVARECTFTPGVRGVQISKEQIIAWNPDIILIHHSTQACKLTVEEVLSNPVLETINAVKNQSVYYTPGAFHLLGADPPRVITEIFYLAKLVHPEKFEDRDIKKEGNELFKRFYGVDGLWTELGMVLDFIE
jgi:ABC-type Fe3+-hydroxamate transport system substrate-binding protein